MAPPPLECLQYWDNIPMFTCRFFPIRLDNVKYPSDDSLVVSSGIICGHSSDCCVSGLARHNEHVGIHGKSAAEREKSQCPSADKIASSGTVINRIIT